jgi:hypothetical protein
VEFFASARSSTGTAVCAGSWGNVERGGRWSLGTRSKLVFRYPAKGDEFYLRLRVSALTRPGEETRSIRIAINDLVDKVMEVPGTASVLDLRIPVRRSKGEPFCANEIVFEPVEPLSPNMATGSADTRLLGVYLVAAQVADDISELSSPPVPAKPAAGAVTRTAQAQSLNSVKELVNLPPRFTGKRPLARIARAIGFDRLWLWMHARQFRRAYASIGLIVDYLQHEKRG